MFLSSQTVKALVNEHLLIRREVSVLKNLNFSPALRKKSLSNLRPIIHAHCNREDDIVYDIAKASESNDLKHLAYQGEVLHMLINYMLDDISVDTDDESEESVIIWSAKAKMLAAIIEFHLNDEEEEFFPKFKKDIDAKTDSELYQKYRSNSETTINYESQGFQQYE